MFSPRPTATLQILLNAENLAEAADAMMHIANTLQGGVEAQGRIGNHQLRLFLAPGADKAETIAGWEQMIMEMVT